MKNTARNAHSMKRGNMLEIIDIVRRGPVSRADVARETGLTRAAVTIIVERLVRDGVISEREPGPGKRPVLLDIARGGLYFMGVDLNRVNCSIGIVDIRGTPVAQTCFGLSPDDALDDILPGLIAGMRGLHGALDRPDRLQGIGISVPGPVDRRIGSVLNPPNIKMLHGQNLLERLAGAIDCGIWLDNNAAARALHEKHTGEGRRFSSFMTMIVDTGVGSGLILEGRLYRGAGFAGEAGHMSIHIDGEPCACGNRGCLELYAAIPALLRRECAARPDIRCWQDVADGAAAGDGHCLTVLGKEAQYLSQGIVNAVNLLDLEAVILTGSIAYRPQLLLERVRQGVHGARIAGKAHGLEILVSGAQPQGGAASAAMIAMEQFFGGDTGWSTSV